MCCPRDSITKSGDAREDFISRFGPHEPLGILVGHGDVLPDRCLQLPGTAMRATVDLFFGQGGEPALHKIDPRGPGRREVHVIARSLHQPPMNEGRLVRAVGVENQVHVERSRHRRIDSCRGTCGTRWPDAADAPGR